MTFLFLCAYFFLRFRILRIMEVILLDNFKVADISPEQVSEIQEFQRKLREEMNRDLVLVAYEPTGK